MNDYTTLDEAEVIEAAKAGDERAMEYLLERYQGLLGHICEKYFLRDGERDDLIIIQKAASNLKILLFSA